MVDESLDADPATRARIRIVWGPGTGPTALSSYDAALAEAGVENYNLVTVSSIVPAVASIEPIGTAPDLGAAGNRLTVVEARVTVGGHSGDGLGHRHDHDDEGGHEGGHGHDQGRVQGHGTAGLAWATGPGPGLFYEVAGAFDEAECRRRLADGLDAGRALREWAFETSDERVVGVEAPAEGFATAVVLGVYGESEPIF